MVLRLSSVVRLKPEMETQYRELHAAIWPEIAQALRDANIRNFSIFLRDGMLYSYLEYIGTDLDADMDSLGSGPSAQLWGELTEACQEPVSTAAAGELWAPLEEVFHLS